MARPNDWEPTETDLTAPVRPALDALAARHVADLPFAELRASAAGALPEARDEAARAALASSVWHRTLVESADAVEPQFDAAAEARILARITRDLTGPTDARPASDAPPPRPAVHRPAAGASWWRLAIPALALAGVALVAVVSIGRMTPAVQAPVAIAPVTGAANAAPLQIEFTKPPVKLTAMALVLRSDGRNARFVDDVAPALAAYRSSDYQTAAAAFAPLAARYPSSVEIPFYLGISRLYLKDPGGAEAAFVAARAITDDTFRADVTWYLAIAEHQSGESEAARRDFDALCQGSSDYRLRACGALSRLAGK